MACIPASELDGQVEILAVPNEVVHILEIPSFGRDVKLLVPCIYNVLHIKDLYPMSKWGFGNIPG